MECSNDWENRARAVMHTVWGRFEERPLRSGVPAAITARFFLRPVTGKPPQNATNSDPQNPLHLRVTGGLRLPTPYNGK